MKEANLKKRMTEVINSVDSETGEILNTEIKSHNYLADTKEEFFLTFTTLLSVFQKISMAEIRVYAFLLNQYRSNCKIVINDIIRRDIVNNTHLSSGSINNALCSLTSTEGRNHPLLYKLGRGTYQLNPRYAFKGGTATRNSSLKAIIEIGCKNC